MGVIEALQEAAWIQAKVTSVQNRIAIEEKAQFLANSPGYSGPVDIFSGLKDPVFENPILNFTGLPSLVYTGGNIVDTATGKIWAIGRQTADAVNAANNNVNEALDTGKLLLAGTGLLVAAYIISRR